MWDSGLGWFKGLLFESELPAKGRYSSIFGTLILVLMFSGGLLHWGFFLSFGTGNFAQDWGEQDCYYSVMRESINDGEMPYIVPHATLCMPPYSERFLGNLQPNLSPQIALLPLMGSGRFILFNTLLMYSVGFVGCLLIMRRYRLSLVPFAILFLLINFNGHITSHISAGHPWNGFFLLPFFILLILELARPDRESKLGPAILLSFVLFGIILQGSFHIYAWCVIFLGILGLFNKRLLPAAFFTIFASAVLSAFRFLPSLFVYGGTRTSYAGGFPTFSTFVDALTTIKAFTYEHPRDTGFYDVQWWEHDVFIGYLGVAFIAFFGIYLRFSGHLSLQVHRFQALDLPILLVSLFSFGIFFDLLSDLQIPFFSWAERVPSRFFILPLLVVAVLGAIRMQAFLPQIKHSATLIVLLLGGVVLLAHSLAAHSWFWRILDQPDRTLKFNSADTPSNFIFPPTSQDMLYTTSVQIGIVISILAVIALCWLFYWKVIRQTR